jgi:cobalt/nickel transport system permease protein
LAAAGAGYALSRMSREKTDRAAPLMGVVAACVFAAQMLNFPILAPVSGHPLGGVLAAALLGPWGGTVVVTVVLVVQCIVFQDGGLTALGANIFNLAVLGAMLGYAILDAVRRFVRGPAGTVAGAVVAAWFTVMLSATACAVEIAWRGDTPLRSILGVLLLFHSMIGVGEAIVTGIALTYVLRTRPDLIYGQAGDSSLARRGLQVAVAGLAVALLLVVFVAPFASTLPDGLEAAIERIGLHPREPGWAAPLPDYQVRAIQNQWLSGVVAGAIGTLVAFGAAFVLARRMVPFGNGQASHAG